MSYQSDIITALKAASTITATTGQRIYWDVADGSAQPPYLVLSTVSVGGETTHDGVREIEFPTIQFSCWSKGKAASVELAAAINTLIDGNTISGTSGVTFQFSNQFGQYESDTKLFGEILEYRASCKTN
jgi:hypothetical protein